MPKNFRYMYDNLNKKTEEKQIRKELKNIIPDYMIPNQFHFKKSLPKNSNGKVDRKQIAQTYFSIAEN